MEQQILSNAGLEKNCSKFARRLSEDYTIPHTTDLVVTTQDLGTIRKGVFKRKSDSDYLVDGIKVPNLILNRQFIKSIEDACVLVADVLALQWCEILGEMKKAKSYSRNRPECWVKRVEKFDLKANLVKGESDIYELDEGEKFKELVKKFTKGLPQLQVTHRYKGKSVKPEMVNKRKCLACKCGAVVLSWRKPSPYLGCLKCSSVLETKVLTKPKK